MEVLCDSSPQEADLLLAVLSCQAEDCRVLWMVLPMVPSNDIKDVETGATVLGDVTVRFPIESGGLIKKL